MKQTITAEIEIPDGWKFERIGIARTGDIYIGYDGEIETAPADGRQLRVIIKPITKLIEGAPYTVWDDENKEGEYSVVTYYGEYEGYSYCRTHEGGRMCTWCNWQELPHFDYKKFEASKEN